MLDSIAGERAVTRDSRYLEVKVTEGPYSNALDGGLQGEALIEVFLKKSEGTIIGRGSYNKCYPASRSDQLVKYMRQRVQEELETHSEEYRRLIAEYSSVDAALDEIAKGLALKQFSGPR